MPEIFVIYIDPDAVKDNQWALVYSKGIVAYFFYLPRMHKYSFVIREFVAYFFSVRQRL